MTEPGLNRKQVLGIGAMAAFSLISYIMYSKIYFRTGYPLDDVWIHQTYARNLAEFGEWAFFPGTPSAGTTSPLWVAILSIGYFLGIDHFLWSLLIGWLLLWGMGLLSVRFLQLLIPEFSQYGVWIGLLITMEWHLVWAAGSGMETLFFSYLLMLLFRCMLQIGQAKLPAKDLFQWGVLGGLSGVTIWVRPEGVILLIFLLIGLGILKKEARDLFARWGVVLMGFLITSVPYLLFNYFLAGEIWPTTFYAKQAEYADLLGKPILSRVFQEGGLFIVGVGSVLLPGCVLFIVRLIRSKMWLELLPVGWFLTHILLFALRLPVVYQHGRYMMPAMPLYFIYGSAGLVVWVARKTGKSWWVLNRVWILSVGCILLVFLVLGARSYAIGVSVIESEMVQTAKWIRQSTDETDLIATHDIGAIGYFSNRRIIDLAGLVSPDVVDFIRNQDELGEYIDQSGAKFLVTFPGVYPKLVECGTLVFQTTSSFSPDAGGENMAVYLWGESDRCVSDK